MKPVRLIFLLFMGAVVFLMASCPGLRDSSRSFAAYRNYSDAKRSHEAAPNPNTTRELQKAERQILEARRLDRREMIIFELIMLGVLGVSSYAFVRAGKRVEVTPPAE